MISHRVFILVLGIFLTTGCSIDRQAITQGAQASRQTAVSSRAHQTVQQDNHSFRSPIAGGLTRVTKKIFGTHVSPGHSPVSPERFTGYHTGIDFETTPAEAFIDIPVSAACDGAVLLARWVSGYGGVLAQRCVVDTQPVTVLYGHLRLSSIAKKAGAAIVAGDPIGVLGQGATHETDGERKHLHFSVHRGTAVELRGYAQKAADSSSWIDPETLLR
jgi:hypothetical protein